MITVEPAFLPTGKYKGVPLTDIPSDYLKWWIRNLSNEVSDEISTQAKEEYDFRCKNNCHFYSKRK